MRSTSILSSVVGLAAATITISDPSPFIGIAEWASDNAILADYSPMPVCYTLEFEHLLQFANRRADYLPLPTIYLN